MKREWKPGDVALVEAGCWANKKVAVRRAEGWAHENGANPDRDGVITPIRPLVVIDAEDREQVERLRVAYHVQRQTNTGGTANDDMQAALRSLLAPPRPEEPTGKWAVVEDAEGDRYLLTDRLAKRGWLRIGTANHLCWDEIDAAVRVLSEGIQP